MFKIGDKVRVIKSDYGVTIPVGSIAKVTNYQADSEDDAEGYDVEFDGNNLFFYPSELETIDKPLVAESSLSGASNTGTKNDSGKSRISLIPTDALVGMGNALKYGEQKYGTHNYRNGLAFSRLVDACLRHLSSWNEGENNDPESFLSHLDHAMASLAMLKFMEINRPDMDDRYIVHKNKIDPEVDQKSLYEQAKEIQKRGR